MNQSCRVSIFSSRPTFRPDDYLQPGKSLTAAEAAKLLGISLTRFRQLAGTRAEPDPVLGPPVKADGVRGAGWPLRAVLQAALARGATGGVPPLLPDPNGPRYRLSTLPEARRMVSVNQRFGDEATAWADLYEPTGYYGRALILVTPLNGAYLSDGDLLRLTRNLAAQTSDFPSTCNGATIVRMPIAGAYDFVPAIRAVTTRLENEQVDMVAAYNVPAADLAGCLGWSAVPVWPEDSVSPAAIAMWAPSSPVPITIPAHAQALWSAAMLAARTADEASDETLRLSARTLEAHLYDAVDGRRHENLSLDDGFESAVEWRPLPRPAHLDEAHTKDFFAAGSLLVSTAGLPAHATDAILGYFGDWAYSAPRGIDRRGIPDHWVQAFGLLRQRVTPLPDNERDTARVRALVAHAMELEPTSVPHVAITGKSYVAFGEDHITTMTWTGYDPETNSDNLSQAWPQDGTEILFGEDRDNGQPVLWALGVDGVPAPIPHQQGPYPFVSLARKAFGGDRKQFSPGKRLESLLSTVTPSQAVAINFTDAVAMLCELPRSN